MFHISRDQSHGRARGFPQSCDNLSDLSKSREMSHDHVIVANMVCHSIPSLELLCLQRFDGGWFGFVRVLLVEKFDKVKGMFHD